MEETIVKFTSLDLIDTFIKIILCYVGEKKFTLGQLSASKPWKFKAIWHPSGKQDTVKSWALALSRFYKLFKKGKIDVYLLKPFNVKLISQL